MTDTGHGELHFRQIVTLLIRRWRLIALITLTGGLLIGAGAFLLPPRYTAKAQLLQNTEYHDGKADVDDAAGARERQAEHVHNDRAVGARHFKFVARGG